MLWAAISAIQRKEPDVVSVVYSGDTDTTKDKIIEKVKARFDIELSPKTLDFVFLESRYLVEDSTWPRFTLLGQSIGSMYLVWEAMTHIIPDLFIGKLHAVGHMHIPPRSMCPSQELMYARRHHGLRLHLPCCLSGRQHSSRCIRPLPDNQHDDAVTRQVSDSRSHQLCRHLVFCCPEYW